jgi:HEAT repeat protein
MNMAMVVCKVLLSAALVMFNAATDFSSGQQAAEQDTQQSTYQGTQPRIDNAKVETRNVAGTLAATIGAAEKKSAGAMWIGYSVQMIAGQRTICCGNYSDGGDVRCGKCELESGHDHWNNISSKKDSGGSAGKTTVKLEGGQALTVLFRLQDHHVTRIKLASEDCVLDAGGLAFVWLTDVKAAESVAYLADYVKKENGEKHSTGNEALTAIALHDGSEAEAALESFAAPGQLEELRKQTSFWLGAARGKEGLNVLQRMAKKDPSTEVRAQVAFALSVSAEPAALDEMIRMAHEDESGHVRGQAIFWLAQKAGKRAAGAIDGAIENDPDTEVKKQAVFALSQLPKDEGVPKLIQVAQNNRNPAVRKQAMFWLGQSEDARALDFFEKVLTK